MKYRRPAPPDHAATKDTIEFHVDTCGYSDNIMRAITLLKSIYDYTGKKRLEYVTTQQSMRELANTSSKEMLLTSRAATAYLRGGDKKPDSKFAQFVDRSRDWVTVYTTSHCERFQQVLVEQILPETLVPIYHTVMKLRSKQQQGIAITSAEWEEWQGMMDRFSLKLDPAKDIKQDPENLLLFYHNTFEQLKSYAYEMMRQDSKTGHYKSAEEVEIVNPHTGRIDDAYIIQSLRVQNVLWKPVAAQPLLVDTHHDCADHALVSYFTNQFAEKPDADRRILVVVTDDVGLRRDFADVITGIHLHSKGKEKTILHPNYYAQMGYAKRDTYPDHLICSSINIRQFFEHRLEEIRNETDSEDDYLEQSLRQMELVIVGIHHDARSKFGRGERSQGLLRSFHGMVEHRKSDKVPHRKPRRSDDGMSLH
jgi:hypothetical protein